MASISEQRLKEMEAEMNRFEQEIAPPDGVSSCPGGMIIGSNTFNTVEAQLRQIRNETGTFLPPPPPPPSNYANNSEKSSDINLPLSALAPPPPPPPEPAPDQQQQQQQQQPPPLLSPPPPPPPLLNRPAFVPPQLRQRPPPPRPPMHHPMGPGPGPHGFHGPGPMSQAPYNHPHNMMGPHMGPGPMNHPMMPMQGPMGYHPPQGSFQQPGFHMMGPGGRGEMVEGGAVESSSDTNSNPAVIEAKPQVVYSSGPVRTVPKKTKKGKAKPEEGSSSAGSSSVEYSSMAATPATYDGESYAGAGMQEESGIAEIEMDTELSVPTKKEKKEKKKKFVRTAASTVWEDPTLAEWDPDDFRMFCGDLGNEVTDETLQRAFSKYPSFVKAKVVRDRRSNKTKGYGFASFRDPIDFTRAMREMNGKYVGNRPIKLRKSTWKDRSIEVVRKKEKEKKRLGLK